MDMGTSIVNMSMNEYSKLIKQTTDEIIKLLKELQEQKQRLKYLEDEYNKIFELKGEYQIFKPVELEPHYYKGQLLYFTQKGE